VESTPATLAEFFPVYRSRHPRPDEQVSLTLVGVPHGAIRRRMQRMLVLVAALTSVGGMVGARTGPFMVWTLFGALVGVVIAFTTTPRRDLPLGAAVSDERVVVAQQRRGQEPVVLAELPAGSIREVSIQANAEPFWLAGRLTRLSLLGRESPIVTIELPNFDPAAARTLFLEAGVSVTGTAVMSSSSSEPARAGEVRFWFPKAFVVGFLYFVGGAFVLLAIATALDEGVGNGAAVLGVAAVLLAAGEGLRRLLLRRSDA
jgi:hypothetical protein